jgi:glycine cleavage system pyridoxal-binding protein P
MLKVIGCESINELIKETVPEEIEAQEKQLLEEKNN